MKKMAWLLFYKTALVLTVVLLVAGITACGNSTTATTSSTTTTTGTAYKLTHDLPDLEYIFSWDTIETRCPDMNDYTKYDKNEAFMGRGNSGGFISLDSNSPAMWLIARVVNKITDGSSVRNISVFMWYFETDKELEEHMETVSNQGITVEKEGNFLTAFVEQTSPIQSAQLVVAGNHIGFSIAEVASSGESLFFSKEDLMAMLPTIKSKISSIEITPLSWPRIPRR